MERKVILRPSAEEDLEQLHDYIVAQAGPVIAGNYIERILEACRSLATFPERGTSRPKVGPGIRTVGFERRATIVFQVSSSHVEIVNVAYGGRDWSSSVDDDSDDR